MFTTYASIDDRIIVDLISRNAKFHSEESAELYLEALARVYTCPNAEKLEPSNREFQVVLWIRGYGINPEDHKKGLLGQYAGLSIKQSNGHFFITVKKIITSVGPPRSRSSSFGMAVAGYTHPSIKHALAGTKLKSYAHGVRILDNLEDEYPTSTIRPFARKLFIYLYNKEHKGMDRKVLKLVQSMRGAWSILIEDSAYLSGEELEADVALIERYRKNIRGFSKEAVADE